MNRQKVYALIAIISTFFTCSALASSCESYINMDENSFTLLASNAPNEIADTLESCLSNEECATSSTPAVCMTRLNYYDSIATYFKQKNIQKKINSASTSDPLGSSLPQRPHNFSRDIDSTPSPSNETRSPKKEQEVPSPTSAPIMKNQDNNIYQNIHF